MGSGSEALRWSESVRDARRSVCGQLGSGQTRLAEVFEARDVPVVGEMYLLVALEALPGALKVVTRRKISALGIDGNTRLVDLDAGEVDMLLYEFDPAAAPGGSGTSEAPRP